MKVYTFLYDTEANDDIEFVNNAILVIIIENIQMTSPCLEPLDR